MVDFRKCIKGFAVLALLLGLAISANAQIGVGAFTCTNAASAVPPLVRAQGLTELVGDIVLNCTGGTPTQNGALIPLSDVTVFMGNNITSRVIGAGGLSEATLMVDEPNSCSVIPQVPSAPPFAQNVCPPANVTSVPNQTVVIPPPGSPPQILCNPVNDPPSGINPGNTGQGNACPEFGKFQGVPSPSPYWNQPNVFSGRQAALGSIVFLGVPIDPPGTTGTRIIRITNLRANATQSGVVTSGIPSQITAIITINGTQQISLNFSQPVASVINGLTAATTAFPFLFVGGAPEQLVQCTNHNETPLGPGTFLTSPDFNIRVTEGFAASFRRRNVALSAAPGTAPPVGSAACAGGIAAAGTCSQNVPGYPYNTESGFYAPTLFPVAADGVHQVGLADFGTRIRLQFNNVGAGVHIYVPLQVALGAAGSPTVGQAIPQPPAPVPAGIGTGILTLVQTDSNGNSAPGFTAQPNFGVTPVNGYVEASYNGTTGYAVYEVVNSDPTVTERADFGIFVSYVSNPASNLPAPGTTTTNTGFAPVSSVGTATAGDPIPRFVDTSTAVAAFSINQCTCNLLFPFVTNQAGFDTGIAIANTTADPFLTPAQNGTVTLNYYGTPTTPPQTSSAINAGQELIFLLSSGNSGQGVAGTPGFQGYIIAQTKFQFCHGFAFIATGGTTGLAEGYLALQMDLGGLNRTLVPGEVLAH